MVVELEAKLASDSGIDLTGLSYITTLTAEELTRVGNRFVAGIRSNPHRTSLSWEKTSAVYDENNEFVCSAPVLPYLSPAQEEAYTAIVRRAAELDMLAIVRNKWNPSLEILVPSRYSD